MQNEKYQDCERRFLGNKMKECCLKNGQGSKALAANFQLPKL